MTPDKLSPAGKKLFSLIEFDDKERLVCEIRKHPIGLVMIYFVGFFISLIMFGIGWGISAMTSGDPVQSDLGIFQPALVIACMVMGGLCLVLMIITAYLYTNNVMLVTTDKITQILNPTLFNRKISQLSIGDVQDVTVGQIGIVPHLFHYGTLVIETAGEQNNYDFTFAPSPYECAKAIVGAHEENLKLYGN
jgi:hypothetical protein